MQDVARKIMSFAQVGPRVVCVMSASGAISNVTLRQQSTSGGTVTYQVSTLHLYGHDIVHSVNKKLSPSLALYDKRLQLSLCSGYKNFSVWLLQIWNSCRVSSIECSPGSLQELVLGVFS